jgi:hypothetical protein
MSSTIGLGGNGTLTGTESTIFDSSADTMSGLIPKIAQYTIWNTDGTNAALIRIPDINGASNWTTIPAGGNAQFTILPKVTIIYGKSSSSSTTISGGPTGQA